MHTNIWKFRANNTCTYHVFGSIVIPFGTIIVMKTRLNAILRTSCQKIQSNCRENKIIKSRNMVEIRFTRNLVGRWVLLQSWRTRKTFFLYVIGSEIDRKKVVDRRHCTGFHAKQD